MDQNQAQRSKGFGNSNHNLTKVKNEKTSKFREKEDKNFGLFNSVVKPLLDADETKKAEPTLRLLAQSGAKITEIYEALYKIAAKENNKSELIYWREKWLNTASKRKDCTQRQAREAKSLGLEKKYIEFLEWIFKIDSHDNENNLSLADAYLKAEKWTKAKAFILASFSKPELNCELLWRLAWIEYESKNNKKSINYLQKLKNFHYTKNSSKDSKIKSIAITIDLASQGKTPTQENLDYCNQLTTKQAEDSWPENRILSTWLSGQHQNTDLAYKLISQAIEIQPKSYLLLKYKAILNLMLNKWSQGFKEILVAEKEKQINSNENQINIVCDGSMGDSLLWTRCILLINQRKTKDIKLYVQPPLLPFLQRNLKDIAKILPKTSNKNKETNNFGVLTLPAISEWKAELSENLPLWKANQSIAEEWKLKLKLNTGIPLIALNWHGSALNAAKENQSTDIPLKAMNPSLYIENSKLQLLAVQKGIGSEEMIKCDFKDKFISEQKQIRNMNSLDQLAGVLSLCDWLICDDSGPAHMASCLGIKTIVCLPEHTDWRWPNNHESPPWYPNTIMIRKNTNEEWESCLQKAWGIINKSVSNDTNLG